VPDPKSDKTGIIFIEKNIPKPNSFSPGKISQETGKNSVENLYKALSLAKKEGFAGIVTAPVSKEAMWLSGIPFPGQTELISDYFGEKYFAMMLISGNFRVAFVTTHHPLKKIPGLLSQALVEEKCLVLQRELINRFQIRNPVIAIAALNPHSGENGKLGDEEIKILTPAVKNLQVSGLDIRGPFPSDTLFTPQKITRFDAFVALYHDQGMIPIKMHGFGKAVNMTAGLPVVRTSPDHGTAFDIAGKGIANESSMVEAIKLAIALVRQGC
ncbi:MAG TPA: 4-hydroxythreonine-4-phosphate dehydrogenase PdxA, partial [Bacteroidetes bacterium]|nr:4-hydroxythreonine-4-phosphate dehydrogenase PdxA [Bacteroidota bacterium]